MKKNNLYKKWRFVKPAIIAAFVVIAGITAVVTNMSEAGGDDGIVISRDAGDSGGQGEDRKSSESNAHDNPSGSQNASSASGTGFAGDVAAVSTESVQGLGSGSTGETGQNPGGLSGEITQEALAVVYICGEVQNPGLYKCSTEDRIADVVQMAGGLKPEADDTCVNMAAKVTDAQQIVIFKKGEQPVGTLAASASASTGSSPQQSGTSSQQAGGLVNINTADEAQFKTLPGIGEQKAKAIISYRQESGGFGRIEDIMKVTGIKDGAFNKIKDMITV